MLRELRDVVENDLVWVPEDIVLFVVLHARVHLSDNTGVDVLKVWMSSKLNSLLLVLEFFGHV